MASADLLFDVADGVATLTLNRPDRLNAWTPGLAAELRDALERATADEATARWR